MKQSPKLPAEVRRAQLVRAAEKLFRKKGYPGTTVDHIAKATRLTKGAVYFHFGSKEELFFEVIRQYWTQNITPFNDFIKSTNGADEFFEGIIGFGFDLIKKERHLPVTFWEQALKIPRITKYWMEEHKKITKALAKEASKRTHLKPAKCEALIRILGAVLDGMIIQRRICKECLDLEVQQKSLNELVKAYLKG